MSCLRAVESQKVTFSPGLHSSGRVTHFCVPESPVSCSLGLPSCSEAVWRSAGQGEVLALSAGQSPITLSEHRRLFTECGLHQRLMQGSPQEGGRKLELPRCAFHCILNISPVRGPADELVDHGPEDHGRTERWTEKRVQVVARMGGPTWASKKHYSPTSSTPPLCPHQPNSQCPSQPQNSTLLGRSKLQDKSGTFLRGLG